MTISEFTLINLIPLINGDSPLTPYMRGQDIVTFFNKHGYNKVYDSDFGPRHEYTQHRLRELNGKPTIKKVIEDIADPRRYIAQSLNVQDAVDVINEYLKYDNCELKLIGNFYKIIDNSGVLVESDTAKDINHTFITEQINKSNKKINEGDYNGAITNARSLIEAIFIEIIERHEGEPVKNDGDMDNLYRQVKKIMKLDIDKDTLPDFVMQILSGIETSLKGLAALSNNCGDRHANRFNTKKHHARLAVNLSITIADFLLDSWTYQQTKKQPVNGKA